VAVQATGLRVVGLEPVSGIPVVAVPDEPGAFVASGLPPAPPLAVSDVGDHASWVSVVGRLGSRSGTPELVVPGARLPIERRCEREPMPAAASVSVTGILLGEPPRLVVPCGGIVPAPLLGRPTALPQADANRRPAAASMVTEPPAPAGATPSALLLLAAMTLAAGAGVARWTARTPPHGPEAAAAEPEAPADEAPPPTLTLVPLPRERAP
jgi:hypothetical protein